jgi:hypothetical protein
MDFRVFRLLLVSIPTLLATLWVFVALMVSLHLTLGLTRSSAAILFAKLVAIQPLSVVQFVQLEHFLDHEPPNVLFAQVDGAAPLRAANALLVQQE